MGVEGEQEGTCWEMCSRKQWRPGVAGAHYMVTEETQKF